MVKGITWEQMGRLYNTRRLNPMLKFWKGKRVYIERNPNKQNDFAPHISDGMLSHECPYIKMGIMVGSSWCTNDCIHFLSEYKEKIIKHKKYVLCTGHMTKETTE